MDMKRHDYLLQMVPPFIHQCRANDPVKAKYFKINYGIIGRETRIVVAEMRENGELIVGNGKGYFMAKDWDEFEKEVRPQMKARFTYLKQFNALKRKFTGEDEKQLALELNIYDNKDKGETMDLLNFTYRKESNGEIGEKNVLVLHEDDSKVEGIDISRLNEDERMEVKEMLAKLAKLKKGNYRRYNKKSFISSSK